METVYLNRGNLAEWQQKAKSNVMALGFFDGVHLGHQEVIRNAFQKAKEKRTLLSVMSFFPHPKFVLSNGKKNVDYLTPLSMKEKIFSSLGVDTFYIVEFDQEFSMLSPEQFAANYLIGLGVVHAVAGFDFTYGSRGLGNLDVLKRDFSSLIDVTKVPKVEFQGEKISSTLIREKLLNGDVADLPDYLGNYYEMECDWDGIHLRPRPYFTIPAHGRYDVNINHNGKLIPAGIMVVEENGHTFLHFETNIDKSVRGKISIIWRERKPKTTYVKIFA
jgi:riboflavin kinase/FMN adenylyltransferase